MEHMATRLLSCEERSNHGNSHGNHDGGSHDSTRSVILLVIVPAIIVCCCNQEQELHQNHLSEHIAVRGFQSYGDVNIMRVQGILLEY